MKFKNLEKAVISTQLLNSGVSEDIDKSKTYQVRLWINMAIQDINTRFMLFNDVFYITQVGINVHNMPDDYMQVLAVLDPQGRRIAINKEDDKTSIYTPTPKTIMIPDCWDNQRLTIVYAAAHDWLLDDSDILPTTTVPIGDHFIKAIMHYVSYLAFETINDTPNYGHHLHLNDYENELQKLDSLGYKPNESLINIGFSQKGFR